MAVVQQFFNKNLTLSMDRDPANLSAGQVTYEMQISQGGDMAVVDGPNNSNIRAFSGRFEIRGFDFEDLAGFPGDRIVSRTAQLDTLGFSLEQLGQSFDVGPSRGKDETPT